MKRTFTPDMILRLAGPAAFKRGEDYAAAGRVISHAEDHGHIAAQPRGSRHGAERALRKMERAIGHVDDSDGYMGEILQRLQSLPLAACEIVRPDPRAVARKAAPPISGSPSLDSESKRNFVKLIDGISF